MNGLNIERISEDMFRINKYNFTRVPFVDVVTTSAPYFHFQILEPKDEEQRAQAIKYFKENEKTYISFIDIPFILLFIGCTQSTFLPYKLQITDNQLFLNTECDFMKKLYFCSKNKFCGMKGIEERE